MTPLARRKGTDHHRLSDEGKERVAKAEDNDDDKD
jgi:hypothetical protein